MKPIALGILVVLLAGQATSAETNGVKFQQKTAVGDKVTWIDATGKERAAELLVNGGKAGNLGGYITYFSYYAGATLRQCKAGVGMGFIVMHGVQKRGWAISTAAEDVQKVQYSTPLQGDHHVIYRAVVYLATDKGVVPCTVDYFFRTGRNDFVYAITFDTKATTGLAADTRTPYVDFDWEGDGTTNGDISGFGWAAGNKQFRTTDEKLTAQSKWDWTKECIIPHVIEWKDKAAGDAEMGLVQTQTFDQHDAGGPGWETAFGQTGSGMPDNWKLTYQLNVYQKYTTKRVTWMMPYGAVGGESYKVFGKTRVASGKPFQSYSVLCILDRRSDGGVDVAVTEETVVHTKCKLTASTGKVADKGIAGAGRSDLASYSPAGWDHVYAMWTLACADNAAACNLAVADGELPNPTFCFTGYAAAAAPKTLSLNGKILSAGTDYFASVDPAGKRLLVTFNSRFAGLKNAVEFRAGK